MNLFRMIQNNKFTEVSLAGIQFRSEVDMISPDNPFEGANKILNNQILETNLGGKGIDLRKAKYTSIKNNVFRNNYWKYNTISIKFCNSKVF